MTLVPLLTTVGRRPSTNGDRTYHLATPTAWVL